MNAVRRFVGWLGAVSWVALCAAGCSWLDTSDDDDPFREQRLVNEMNEKTNFPDPEDVRRTRMENAAKFLALPESQRKPIARPQGPTAPAGPIVPPGPIPSTPTQTGVSPAAATSTDVATQIRVVAMIGSDVVITDDEVLQMVRQRGIEYVRLTGTARDAKEKELFQDELRRLIERELILNDFLGKIKKNKPQVLDVVKEQAQQAVTRQLKEFKKLNNFKSEAEFTEALKAQGLSMKGLQRQLERNAMMNMFLAEIMREKGKNTSLAEVIRYYEEHSEEFKIEDQVKWLDLFVSYRRFNTTVEARQYAEQLLQQAKAGTDFVQLVKQYGHGDSPLRDGEGIGQKRGEIQPKELEPTILALTKGQLSAIVPTETGFHIMKVVEREQAGYRPFDEKTQLYIRGKLAGQIKQADYDKLIEDLWRKTTVRVIE